MIGIRRIAERLPSAPSCALDGRDGHGRARRFRQGTDWLPCDPFAEWRSDVRVSRCRGRTYRWSSNHPLSLCRSHRDAGRVETAQAKHVDAKEVRRHAFAMERIYAARSTEVVAGRLRVKLVLDQAVASTQQPKPRFVNLDHERVLAAADRTIAGRQLGEVGLDLEVDGAAVAAARVSSNGSSTHTRPFRSDPGGESIISARCRTWETPQSASCPARPCGARSS